MEGKILLKCREDGTWEEYTGSFATIECQTEEDLRYLEAAVKHYKKQGKWLPRGGDPDSPIRYCSDCKADIDAIKALYYKFCPECGARNKVSDR